VGFARSRERAERLDGVSPHRRRNGWEDAELGPAWVEGVLVLLLVLGPMGELGRRRRRCSGSSTSTALRAEYECEYDRGRIGS